MKKFHYIHFIVLLIILALGIGLFFYTQSNRMLQLAVGIATAIAYITWGVIHHAMQRDLYAKVVVEYVLMGLIAILLLLTILGP